MGQIPKRMERCLPFVLAVALPLVPGALVEAAILETWEGEANGAFDGSTASNVWLGDATSFFIDSATWPVSPTPDFAGAHSLRSPDTNAAMNLTTVTSMAGTFDAGRTMEWSVFVSGGSQSITSTPRDFSLILMSDSSTAASIESGSINGYRLRLGDDPALGASTDSLLFEEANGSGWSILTNIALSGLDRNINEGWNLLVQRTSAGVFTFGFANGAIGTPVPLSFSTTDTTVTSATFAGMNYRTPATGDNAFGFDNFRVSVPEPATLALLGLGLAGLGFGRRKRT